jgi:hypothetical protein
MFLADEFRVAVNATAMRAHRTIRPSDALQQFAGFVFGQFGKLRKVHFGHALIV